MKKNHLETTYSHLAEAIAKLFYPFTEVRLLKSDQITVVTEYNKLSKEKKRSRSTKSESIPLKGKDGKTEGYLEITFNTTSFDELRQVLNSFLEPTSESTSLPWEQEVECSIQTYLKKNKYTLEGMSRLEKRELVHHLEKRGLFRYQDAASTIADRLSLSRATVYNYLKWAHTLQTVHIHQVDAFTDQPFSGNPAGVVLDAETLDDDSMKKITREMNLPETSFVLPSKKADFYLRYFTPTGDEVAFCGHSTVGALYMLAREKRLGISHPGTFSFQVETKAGILNMETSITSEKNITVSYEAPKIQLKKAPFSHKKICSALGISLESVNTDLPVMIEATNRIAYLTIPTLSDLEQVQCDFRSTAAFCKQKNLIAITLLTPETFEPSHHVHTRCFCPAVGIPEDPFTGSMQGGLAAYLLENEILPKKTKTIRSEQGHFVDRPGFVEMTIHKKNGQYHAKIHAQAVHFFSTEINLS